MIAHPVSSWALLASIAFLTAAVFVVLGYGMILLPFCFIMMALLLGAAGALFGSR